MTFNFNAAFSYLRNASFILSVFAFVISYLVVKSGHSTGAGLAWIFTGGILFGIIFGALAEATNPVISKEQPK